MPLECGAPAPLWIVGLFTVRCRLAIRAGMRQLAVGEVCLVVERDGAGQVAPKRKR